jgi:hypothetical protein
LILTVIGMVWASIGHASHGHIDGPKGTFESISAEVDSDLELDMDQLTVDMCCIVGSGSCTFGALAANAECFREASLRIVASNFVDLVITGRNPSSDPPPPRS